LLIVLAAIPTLRAIVTNIRQRLNTSTISDIPALDVFADFHDYTSTLVTRTSYAKVGHGREGPVVHHEVDVWHAEAGAVEADQEFVILWECIVSMRRLKRLCGVDVLGSGTSTICTSTLKSFPSFTTTPAFPCLGISSDIVDDVRNAFF
jgi:hypothetical protein